MVDRLHQRGVGVILDWVPSHFPMDPHGLARFDGTHLYEHADPRQGYHPDWTSAIFNYGRREVRSFLISSALSWLDRYHVDGLRVDAVASMLYLDYSRADGEWIPNRLGGRENLDAIDFLRQLNDAIDEEFPDAATFAEESTAWPMVTGPTAHGGLGFSYKWDMGWMHDTLQYIRREPVHRRFHHDEITFRGVYAFTRALRAAAVARRGRPRQGLAARQDARRRVAALRQPAAAVRDDVGAAGQEAAVHGRRAGDAVGVGPRGDARLEPPRRPAHDGVRRWVAALNDALPQRAGAGARRRRPGRVQWIIGDDDTHSVFAWLRADPTGAAPPVLVVINATPTVHYGYRVGVPQGGQWTELLNSDAEVYGGSGMGNLGGVAAEDQPWHGSDHSLPLTLPPLAVVLLRPDEPLRRTDSDAPRSR